MLIHSITGQLVKCVIVDVSRGGAQLEIVARDIPEGLLSLFDPEGGETHDLVIVWRAEGRLGVSFAASSKLPV